MYCSNCGMKLPDWAHYCERCGARVRRVAVGDDPFEHIGLDDTSASEPLWADEAAGPTDVEEGPAPDGPPHVDRGTEPMEGDGAEAGGVPGEPLAGDTIQAGPLPESVDDTVEDLLPEGGDPSGETALQEDLGDLTQPMQEDLEDLTQPMAAPEDLMGEVPNDEEDPGPEAEPSEGDLDGEGPVGQAGQEAPEEDAQDREAGLSDGEASESDEGSLEPGAGAVPEQDKAAADADGPYANVSDVYADLPYEDRRVVDADVGDLYPETSLSAYRHAADAWQGRQRPSERRKVGQPVLPMAMVAAIAAGAILLSFLVSYVVLGGASSGDDAAEEATAVTSRPVKRRKAEMIIEGLEGWWTTNRTFDGRFWRIRDGVLQTYAADGNLAREDTIDPDAIERMSEGPGGIGGEGYYLRDIAFFLLDSDPDTLHAINGDGSADEDANLHRTTPPPFADDEEEEAEDATPEPEEPADEEPDPASEYVLPESSTRVYEVSELEPLSDHDLFLARNEIFARHGYAFSPGELSEYFASKSWYQPVEVFNEGDINEVERQNVNNILAVEQSRNSPYL